MRIFVRKTKKEKKSQRAKKKLEKITTEIFALKHFGVVLKDVKCMQWQRTKYDFILLFVHFKYKQRASEFSTIVYTTAKYRRE